ncbi:MAG: PAS domain-containing hybrid sensor histidine kinase/response regulator, partial [Desulfobaccales bacterium]
EVGAEGLRFETVHRRQDGSIYDVEISANWVMLAGRKLGFCVCRNISRRKAAEKALRESEERLRLVNEAANIGTYDADLQTGIARYSPELCAILGVPPVAEWNIQEAIKVVHPEDRAQVEAVIRHAREPRGDGRFYCEHRIIRPDGEVRWLVWIGRAIFGETANGRVPLREIGAGLDITAHKRVEGALREGEEKYRGLIETTNTGYVIIDRKGRVLDANPEYVRLTGYSELVEILGRNVLDWTAEPDRAKNAAALEQCLDTGIVKNLELDYLGRDGRSIPVEINATSIRTSEGAKFLSLVRDISARKQAEKEKAILEAQLARAQKLESLGTLAGGIAHEFNNILVAIMGYAELAQMDLETSPEPAKPLDSIKHILTASSRARDLIKQILTFSRKENLDLKAVRPHHVVTETVNLLRGSIPKTIDIDYQADRSRGAILADSVQLQQIVMNLGTNAFQAMGPKGVLKIRLEEIITDSEVGRLSPDLQAGSYLRLTVADNGRGMDQETLAHIFDPFFTTKEVGQGTGLGLAVVYGIVKNMGGAITVQSDPGRGTTFSLYFPLYISPEDEETRPDLEPISGQGRILLVDDEDAVAEIEARLLQKLGYEVIVVKDGLSALEFFTEKSEAIDLVITDQTMPKMTGMELALAIKVIRPEMPVILYSGYSNLASDKNLPDAGIDKILTKPIRLRELSEAVKEILGGSPQ